MKNQGKLTVFLGAVAGVGKTYAMLEAAKERLSEGTDVVIGFVETHGSLETETVLKGIPYISSKTQEFLGKLVQEMDLEVLLERHPQLVVVDELAHTNIPGSRHRKRYQDVEELLASGIDVYTTLNIQHLESLNDVVAQITGVTVSETVPDRILEIASQIQMVDITPDELIQRLKEGKVNVPGVAAEAIEKFFRPGNINALREMSLRYTAKRVDCQMESYMRNHGIAGPWPSGEKVMVCVSGNPFSTKLIRTAKRMAARQNAEWLAVHVVLPGEMQKNENEKDLMEENLRMAEKLGAEIVTPHGDDIVEELLTLARKRNVSQIIIGKPERARFQELFHGSVVDKVIRRSHGISVHVISGRKNAADRKRETIAEDNNTSLGHLSRRQRYSATPYLMSVLMMSALTVAVSPIETFLGPVNIPMLYLLPVLLTAARWGRLPALITAGMGVIIFDYFFVPPFYTLHVDDFRYVISFVILMIAGIVTGTLSGRLTDQINYSRQREQQVSALYSLSRDLTAVDKLERILDSIARKIGETLDGQVVLLLPDERNNLVLSQSSSTDHFMTESEMNVASWVYERGQKAGRGTETLRSAKALYLPLITEQGTHGVLGICFFHQNDIVSPQQIRFLDAFAGLAALAINRIKLADEARQAHALAESERLRTALFNSLSHDLRTPLSSIIGAATGLLEDEDVVYSPDARHDLLQTILQGAERMNRFVNNLLDMARLESGMLKLHKDWCDIQDIIGVAINRLDIVLAKRLLDINIPAGLPLVQADYALIEQVIVNLLDNAVKYSEPVSKIVISVKQVGQNLEISVANRGNPIPETDLSKVFDKFYRLTSPLQVSGSGLGLSICKGIIESHNGDIWAENNELGGVTIIFTLPLEYELSDKLPIEGGD
ncbi:osmosensitive K+ channel histidine kinase [Desulfosporosinus acidiphilus SJ4]|uniref:histidine kinase n=1 Tax=Desulfosporosinus acidiphilus (strain DSM 22704 / JCM 16185 / SJ4) TaxID=646529 RepID=I4D558_DESAJ|nr:sensor histidine kinase KdpD [Desulfosporosinus acidiphilus]AFM40932.1 osmosensitive K+ channel histidine kinase [Desulfosporosinus acidiphilus SJ4]